MTWLAPEQASVKESHTADARTVLLNGEKQPQTYVLNEIRTSKYGLVNFLPVFLFTMFRRVAYLYFLAQVHFASCLSKTVTWITMVSSSGCKPRQRLLRCARQ